MFETEEKKKKQPEICQTCYFSDPNFQLYFCSFQEEIRSAEETCVRWAEKGAVTIIPPEDDSSY